MIKENIPILGWIRDYECSRDLALDVVGGLTVGVMHVPQGIAYALLAGQQPIVGLYTSIIPGLIYMLFGTSKHASIGTFAVVALMTGDCVEREVSGLSKPTAIEISCALVFTVGLVQILMALLKVQNAMNYMSDQFVEGFTTAASIHVLVSQLRTFFGLNHLPKSSGPGYLVKNLYSLLVNIFDSNWMCCVIGFTTIIVLIVGKSFSKVLIPWELVTVILATIFSTIIDANPKFSVKVVGKIPNGLPTFQSPRFDLIPSIYQDSIKIAIVIVAVHLSLAKLLATRQNYQIVPRQELLALSIASIVASFFPVLPPSCALARTMVGVEAGIRTQLATVFSCILVASVTLWFGRFLENLPLCVLSAIVIVALKSVVSKLAKLKEVWQISKVDCSIWLLAFLATTLIDISEGLLIALCYSIFITTLKHYCPKWFNNSSQSFDNPNYENTIFPKGVCSFRFDGSLLSHNVEHFKKSVQVAYREWRQSPQFHENYEEIHLNNSCLSHHLILDLSAIGSIDSNGIDGLEQIFSDMKQRGVTVFFVMSDFYKVVGEEHIFQNLEAATSMAGQSAKKRSLLSKTNVVRKYTEELEMANVRVY